MPIGEQVFGSPAATRLVWSICAARLTQLWFCAAIGPLSRSAGGMRYGSSALRQTTTSSGVESGHFCPAAMVTLRMRCGAAPVWALASVGAATTAAATAMKDKERITGDFSFARTTFGTVGGSASALPFVAWVAGMVQRVMAAAMILVVDNYDSFTWNLVHYLQELGAEVEVVRNDAISAGQALSSGAEAFLISPGPCTPTQAGVSLDLVEACAAEARPLLGVCLGHQAIGQHFGGRVERGGLMHGKTSPIVHDGSGMFAGLPSPFTATRYHSLIVNDVPAVLHVNARVEDGTVMAFRHAQLPIHGVQFHPESIATEHGHAMLANFMRAAGMAVQERESSSPLPLAGGVGGGQRGERTALGLPSPNPSRQREGNTP